MLNVEFLYFEGCPGQRAAFSILQRVLAEERARTDVVRIKVSGPEVVAEHRFLGSPSIRIDGEDLEGLEVEKVLGYGWRCRQYEEWEPGESRAVPAGELIRRRLRELIKKSK